MEEVKSEEYVRFEAMMKALVAVPKSAIQSAKKVERKKPVAKQLAGKKKEPPA